MLWVLSALGMAACQSAPEVGTGIQPKYAAINPTRILAVTPVAVSLPRLPGSVIDPSILRTLPIMEWVESGVLRAFAGQPAVNGVSFQAVRRSLEQSGSPARSTLVSALESTVGALQRPGAENRGLVSQECFARRDVLDFYSHCLTQNPLWKKGLNELSAAVLNADAALFTFVTELRVQPSGDSDLGQMSVAVLLVDTNNGDLIWSGLARSDSLPLAVIPRGGKPSRDWKRITDALMDEPLWTGFPGRLGRDPTGGSPGPSPTPAPLPGAPAGPGSASPGGRS